MAKKRVTGTRISQESNKLDSIKKNNGQSKRKSKDKKPKSISKTRKFFKYLFITLSLLILTTCVIALGYTLAIIQSTPPLDIDKIVAGNQPTDIRDRNGNYIDTKKVTTSRIPAKSDEIPTDLKNAIISIEDQRFMSHPGVDIKRLGGSLIHSLKYAITGEGGLHGASTLTQQLIKNTMLTNEKKLERKIKEMYLALQLEKKLSKDDILTAYLNVFPVGGVAYGAKAGAKMYFNKDVKNLNLIECAYLAGVTQSTHSYNAFVDKNQKDPSAYINRTKTVLMKMNELGYINNETYEKSLKDLDSGKLKFTRGKIDYKLKFESAIDPAIAQVKRDFIEKHKCTDEEVSNLIANGSLTIHTTIDSKLQEEVQKIIDDSSTYGLSSGEARDKNGVPKLQASAVITDYRTGEVLAMVGGRGNQPAKSANRAYDRFRPIGSSIKPLTVYGPAIEEKISTAATAIDDAPLPSDIQQKYNGSNSWNVKNSPNTYHGLTTLRDSIKRSSNIGSILTGDKLGLNVGISYGEKVGIKFSDESKGMSAMALGQFFNHPKNPDGANPFIMASAIGTFGNEGVYIEPKLYSKVTDRDGNVILESPKNSNQIFSKETSYIMYDLMKGSVSHTGPKAQFSNIPVSGKTGTATDSKDLWFTGLTPYYSAAVWVGYDNPKSIPLSSNSVAGVWGKVMSAAHKGAAVKDLVKPDTIVNQNICIDSGLLPTSACSSDPRGNRIRSEMFIPNSAPSTYCETHVSAEINRLNGKLASSSTPGYLKASKIFIKKAYFNSVTLDSKYVLPSSYDDMSFPSIFPNLDGETEEKPEVKPSPGEEPTPDTDDSNTQTELPPTIEPRKFNLAS